MKSSCGYTVSKCCYVTRPLNLCLDMVWIWFIVMYLNAEVLHLSNHNLRAQACDGGVLLMGVWLHSVCQPTRNMLKTVA
jgi:hypothetical protein